jgi:RNA polymerase sigma factor (sigma-70 family)
MINNKDLIVKLKSGDHQAFKQIYDKYYQLILNYNKKMLKISSLAEDVSQETFMTLYINRDKVNQYKNFKSYLFTINNHKVFDALKKISKEKNRLNYFIDHIEIQRNDELAVSLQNKYDNEEDIIDNIHYHLKTLTKRQNQVIKLIKFQGKSYKETAIELNIKTSTVKDHLKAALKCLKKKLS